MQSFTDEDLLQITLAYELSGSSLTCEEYLAHISERYQDFKKAYKCSKKPGTAKVGNARKLGL